MIRSVLLSVVLLAVLLYAITRLVAMLQGAMPERVTRIDVYADRITYRAHTYETTSQLAVGLKAAGDPPQKLAVHDCARMDELAVILDLLRRQGMSNVDVELPDDC
jgi:hypothetical protein